MCKTNVDTNALVRKYEPLIYAVLTKKLSEYIGDEDLVQVGRIALWRCAKRYDPDKGKFSTYAYTAIYHAMLKELGKRKTEISLNTPIAGEEELELKDTIADLRLGMEGVELKFELEDFMKQLTTRQKTVLTLKANGKTRKEIAEQLGVSYDLIVKEMKAINAKWKVFHNSLEEAEECYQS
jgi:DNA-directed RNA polymerase